MKRILVIILLSLFPYFVIANDNNKSHLVKHSTDIVRMFRLIVSNAYLWPSHIEYDQENSKFEKHFFITTSNIKSDNSMFDKIMLEWDGDNIKNIYYNNSKLIISWDTKNRINHIQNKGFTGHDLYLHYDEQTNKVDQAVFKGVKPNTFMVYNIIWDGDNVAEISSYNQNKKKFSYYDNKKYSYSKSEFSSEVTAYEIKSIKRKPVIRNNYISKYIIVDSLFHQKTSNGRITKDFYFNDNFRLVKSIYYSKYDTQISINHFRNDSLFRTEKLVKDKDDFKNHSINVKYSLSEEYQHLPVWEWKSGNYKFDANGTLIYESRGYQYRVFEFGKWSEWRGFTY